MLLTHLSPSERTLLACRSEELRVEAGRTVVEQGDGAAAFYVILEGVAAVVQDGRPVVELRAGDFFGELALLETGLRTASVIASTELSMLVVARRDFERVLDALPTAAARVRRVALDRLIGLR